ncbi:MAG: thiamine-phosphate kinase [Candidatus Thermoplasmatota archaeon]|nr:thiamine-phosphate kinase [Candidatus Thermoplasmatota archaeon]MBU1940891.1 thiamine-phosphate kinase [Candidatus Thermoplasmatota archaeon]
MTSLADIGERAALREIFSIITRSQTITIGPGDDCAAIEIKNDYLLASTDMIHIKTHIHQKMRPWQIGWFIAAINISDIAAKGGTLLGILMSIGLPRQAPIADLKEIMKGADACATHYSTTIIGGDLKEASELTITGTALGIMPKNQFMSRSGCQPGDIVVVTGELGKAGAGYYSLDIDDEFAAAQKSLFEPQPRLHEGIYLASQQQISSCMDLSDGLSTSLYQLAEINNIGFEIYQSKLPLSPLLIDLAQKIGCDPLSIALHYGGDYELLATIPSKYYDQLQKNYKKNFSTLTAIGTVTKKKTITLIDLSKTYTLPNKGYEHFKS